MAKYLLGTVLSNLSGFWNQCVESENGKVEGQLAGLEVELTKVECDELERHLIKHVNALVKKLGPHAEEVVDMNKKDGAEDPDLSLVV